VAKNIKDKISMEKKKGIRVKYLHRDNSREQKELSPYCGTQKIKLKMTAPRTPQHNGVVYQSFATDL